MPEILPAVKGLIVNGDTFLIVKDQIHKETGEIVTYWDLPGGKPYYNESPYNALLREIKEETTLDVELKEIIGMFWFISVSQSERVCTVFRCLPHGTHVALDRHPEADPLLDYRWVTREEFLSEEYEVLHDSLKALIRHVAV